MPRSARWTIGLENEALASVEGEIDGFLTSTGADDRARFVARLVIEEIVRNLVHHTDPDGPPYEEVWVTVHADADALRVVIEDARPPFDPADAPALDVDAPLEARRAGGMGVHLVRTLTDDLTYERVADRNRLTATILRA